MANIKLSDYCKKNGISYITGYRWFKDGKLPVKASQTDSGTILVEDDATPTPPVVDGATDATALFLKKTLEYSKNNSSIEDFAAYIFSTFKLKLQTQSDPLPPRYSKVKPKPEDIQDHFKKVLDQTSHTKEKPKPHMYIPDPKTWESLSGESVSKLESVAEVGSAKVLQSNYATVLSNSGNRLGFSAAPAGSVQSNLLSSMVGDGATFGMGGVTYNCSSAPDFDLSELSAAKCNLGLNTNYFVSTPEIDIESTVAEKPKRGRPKKITRTE